MGLVTVSDLVCSRGGVPVLERVSFALGTGEALVLRGPNGSGKTTLLRTLAGLQPPLSGQIEAAPDAIAFAGHADGLKPTLTGRENLAFWAAIYGGGDIEAALSAFDLTALGDRQAQHLSAGQKRRLGLSRMLVTGRPVWMLDEPTVSLDSASVRQFAEMVERHLAAGGAALIATHVDLGLAGAAELDLSGLAARPRAPSGFDEAFA